MEFLDMDKRDRIAVVTINRPKVLNALNPGVLGELACCFEGLRTDEEVGAVIVTGSGEKAFVAGADIKVLATLDVHGARDNAEKGQGAFRTIERFPKPVIAAVNGFALGGGCELALACHMRIASTKAKFGLPEVSLGLIPGYGGTQRLARIIGKGRALEMILSGDMINAERAYETGLANQVVEPESLLDTARKLAATILGRGPVAVRLALEAVTHGLEMNQEDGERLEAALFGSLAATEDTREGLAAFLEKRAPEFKGR
ncbi:MAG: enoyl-CoA hydratase-related protein [Acidobacteriota bacterium]|nr:enoyl-CoA hydratase-related protein [Acidobacteriota bacterium]